MENDTAPTPSLPSHYGIATVVDLTTKQYAYNHTIALLGGYRAICRYVHDLKVIA